MAKLTEDRPYGLDRISVLAIEARRRFEALTPEQQKAHREAQRASYVRGMTTGCEHGVLDFEQCPDCRAALSHKGK